MKGKKQGNLKDKKIRAIPDKQKITQQAPKVQASLNQKQEPKAKQKQPALQVSVNEFNDKPKSQTQIQQLAKLKEQMSISQFIEQKFKKVIEQGLKEIVHVRPQDPIRYLGQYLINHSK